MLEEMLRKIFPGCINCFLPLMLSIHSHQELHKRKSMTPDNRMPVGLVARLNKVIPKRPRGHQQTYS